MSFADDTSSDEDEAYSTTLWRRRCRHAKGYLSNAPAQEMKALLLLGIATWQQLSASM